MRRKSLKLTLEKAKGFLNKSNWVFKTAASNLVFNEAFISS